MNKLKIVFLGIIAFVLTSCITSREVRYLQPSESLVLNEEGLVSYNMQEYRVTKSDMFSLNIITTPKGDAAQFYSRYNTSGGLIGWGETNTHYNDNNNNKNNNNNYTIGSTSGGRANFYFHGIKVDANGDINILGIGYIKAEGRTIKEIRDEIQQKVNENFLPDKAEVRLNIDGITYYVLGDIETTGITGEKKAYVQNLSIPQALALNGGLNRTIDRKSIYIERRFPEGIKRVKIDLTKEDVMNSPYYWVQNGDIIYLNTRPKNFYGFGKDPMQTLTTGISMMTTALSIYLLISRF